MKILNKHKYLSLFLVLLISISSFGLVYIGKHTDNTEASIENPPLSYILMKLTQPTFKIQEQVLGQTPEVKVREIISSIIDKNTNNYESLYPIEKLGHIGMYKEDRLGTDNLNEIKENIAKQRSEAKNMLWKENISSYKVLSAKYYNQPCCAMGWDETTNLEWIGMARYEIEFTTKDSRKLKYNIEITVSNPGWLEPGEQVEVRNWIITNISDKDLPELYSGI